MLVDCFGFGVLFSWAWLILLTYYFLVNGVCVVIWYLLCCVFVSCCVVWVVFLFKLGLLDVLLGYACVGILLIICELFVLLVVLVSCLVVWV